MGEEIFISAAQKTSAWVGVAVVFGLVGTSIFIAIGIVLGYLTHLRKALCGLTLAVVIAAYGASWFGIVGVVKPPLVTKLVAEQAAAQGAALDAQRSYSSTPLYLKERATDPGSWGEIKGELKSGFLSASGSIYGKIESGRVLTVVYEHPNEITFINGQYAGMHLVFSAPLPEIVIETIPKGTKPFMLFPEASVEVRGATHYYVIPGRAHLYLPEGWTIL